MTALEVLAELRNAGIRVEPRPNGNLYLAPKDRLTPDLVERARTHKADLLRLLREGAAVTRVLDTFEGARFLRESDTNGIATREASKADAATWRRGVVPDSSNPLIPDSIRAKIRAIETDARAKGWDPERLWNSNFWDQPRGRAAVLEPDDEIAEVTADYIAILMEKNILRFQRRTS